MKIVDIDGLKTFKTNLDEQVVKTLKDNVADIENRITQNSSNLETAKQELSNKCNEALSQAKAYTDTEKANLVKKSGDKLTGVEFTRNVDNSSLKFYGGTTWGRSASISLTGNKADSPCSVDLLCHNPTSEEISDFNCLHLQYKKTPTWNGNPIEIVNSVGNNYIRYSSGLTFMWGSFGVDAGLKRKTVNLPIPFNSTYNVILTNQGNNNAYGALLGYQVVVTSLSTFDIQHTCDGATGWYYLAIGY